MQTDRTDAVFTPAEPVTDDDVIVGPPDDADAETEQKAKEPDAFLVTYADRPDDVHEFVVRPIHLWELSEVRNLNDMQRGLTLAWISAGKPGYTGGLADGRLVGRAVKKWLGTLDNLEERATAPDPTEPRPQG